MSAPDRNAYDSASPDSEAQVHRTLRLALFALGLAAIVALVALAASLRASGPLDPSDSGEQVLRTLRLAGFDHAVVAADDAGSVVLLQLTGVDSPAEIQIAWQTAFAAASSAGLKGPDIAVSLAVDGEVVVTLYGPAEEIERAVAASDAGLLRDVVSLEYVLRDAEEVGPQPSDVLAQAVAPEDAAYLDAKNRAAGLLGDEGPSMPEIEGLESEVAAMRRSVEGRPAVPAEDAVREYAGRIGTTIDRSEAGADRVLDAVRQTAEAAVTDPGAASRLRLVSLVVEAVSADAPYGDLIGGTARVCERVASADLETGPLSEAVLAAAGDPSAPDDAIRVADFDRVPGLDMGPDGGAARPVEAVVRALSSGVPVSLEDAVETVPPQTWEAYRRADGTVFWVGESGTRFALTDGSLRGWAYSRGAAAVVDPEDVGTVYSLFASDSVPR